MKQSLKDFFKKTFKFSGRATRKEYWVPNILFAVLGIVLSSFRAPDKVQNALVGIFAVPTIALTSRRYQDAGVSGWFQAPQMLSFILLPVVFMSFAKRGMKAAAITVVLLLNIVGFILTLLPSDGNNKYGKRP
ncbi:DUF805 domain-containing protein [Salinicoccus sp. HZC-1]|uniref:DUF805 domain-containing protein n=1 Tax=Salinicoccus sp. HZC-1 TaxID=3385497 RepID=UPI00398B87CB